MTSRKNINFLSLLTRWENIMEQAILYVAAALMIGLGAAGTAIGFGIAMYLIFAVQL